MKALTELALATGTPVAELQAWASAPAPDGIDPQVWADAQRTRVDRARPWEEEPLGRLPHYMDGVLPKVYADQDQEQIDQVAAQAA